MTTEIQKGIAKRVLFSRERSGGECARMECSRLNRLAALGVLGAALLMNPLSVLAAGDPIPGVDISLEQKPGSVVAAAYAGDPIPGVDISLEQKPGGVIAPNCIGSLGLETITVEPLIYEHGGATFGGGSGPEVMSLSGFGGSFASERPVRIEQPGGGVEEYTVIVKILDSSSGQVTMDNTRPDGGVVSASGSYYDLDFLWEVRPVSGTGMSTFIKSSERFELQADVPWSNDLPGGMGTTGFVFGADAITTYLASFEPVISGFSLNTANTVPADSDGNPLQPIGPYLIYQYRFAVPGATALEAMAYDSRTGNLYGVEPGSPDVLLEFDACGGIVASTPLAFLGAGESIRSMTFLKDTNTLLMATDPVGAFVETSTAGTPIGSIPNLTGVVSEGLAYDASTDTVIASRATSSFDVITRSTGAIVSTLPIPHSGNRGAAFDGTRVFVASDSASVVAAYDPVAGDALNESPTSVASSGASAFGGGKLYLWNDADDRVEVYPSEFDRLPEGIAGLETTSGAGWPVAPPVETIDVSTLASTGGRSISGTRKIRQTFQVAEDLLLDAIHLSVGAGGLQNQEAFTVRFFEIDAIEALTWAPGDQVGPTITVPPGMLGTGSGISTLRIPIPICDQFVIPQRDAGTTGYGIEIQPVDAAAPRPFTWRHAFDGSDYAPGRYYSESGSASGGVGNDMGMALTVPEPAFGALLAAGTVMVGGLGRRRRA